MRRRYVLSDKELKKARDFARMALEKRAWADANKKRLGKRYPLECREAGLQALKGDPEYLRGMGQGRLDRAMGLAYSEERTNSAYNLGYYRGYVDYEHDVRGGLVLNVGDYPLMG